MENGQKPQGIAPEEASLQGQAEQQGNKGKLHVENLEPEVADWIKDLGWEIEDESAEESQKEELRQEVPMAPNERRVIKIAPSELIKAVDRATDWVSEKAADAVITHGRTMLQKGIKAGIYALPGYFAGKALWERIPEERKAEAANVVAGIAQQGGELANQGLQQAQAFGEAVSSGASQLAQQAGEAARGIGAMLPSTETVKQTAMTAADMALVAVTGWEAVNAAVAVGEVSSKLIGTAAENVGARLWDIKNRAQTIAKEAVLTTTDSAGQAGVEATKVATTLAVEVPTQILMNGVKLATETVAKVKMFGSDTLNKGANALETTFGEVKVKDKKVDRLIEQADKAGLTVVSKVIKAENSIRVLARETIAKTRELADSAKESAIADGNTAAKLDAFIATIPGMTTRGALTELSTRLEASANAHAVAVQREIDAQINDPDFNVATTLNAARTNVAQTVGQAARGWANRSAVVALGKALFSGAKAAAKGAVTGAQAVGNMAQQAYSAGSAAFANAQAAAQNAAANAPKFTIGL